MATLYNPSIVRNGLVLNLDAANIRSYPGSGTNWTDLNGTGTTLTLQNGPTYSSTDSGSILFDGVNDFASTATSLVNRTNGQEITVSCWIKPTRNAGQYSIICTNRSSDASVYNWIFYQHTNDGAISFHGSAQNKSSYVPALNTWVNVTNTVTAAGVSTLYVNGVSTYIVTGYTYGGVPSRLAIGSNNGASEPFQGNISQVSIYNRALTQAEILQNYNALKGRYGL